MADAPTGISISWDMVVGLVITALIPLTFRIIQMEIRRTDSWFRRQMRDQGIGSAYRSVRTGVLDRLDRWLVPEELANSKLTDPARA